MAKPNAKAPLGQGGRFAALKAKVAKSGARDPGAVAAAIGRKKYGKKKFQSLAAKGKISSHNSPIEYTPSHKQQKRTKWGIS